MRLISVLIALITFWKSGAADAALVKEVALPHPYRIVDLTHTLDANFPYIPVPGITFPFALEPIATIEENHVAANSWRIHEHLGTQIDAPNHFVIGGAGLHEITAEELIVPAVVIDFRRRARADRDAELTVEDILSWESRFGRIPDGVSVILYTGWDTKLHDADGAFVGLDEQGVKHFPGIGVEAANFLAEKRGIRGVGVDTISFDPGPDGEYRTHRAILGAGRWALECLANVRYLPPQGAVLFVGAPKVRDATGGPVRVVALAPVVPAFDVSRLNGTWRSERPERTERADGSITYLHREFRFRPGTWDIHFTVSEDAEGRKPLLSGDFGGPFEIGSYTPLLEAFEGRFLFARRTLTPGNDQTAAALNAAGCAQSAQPGMAEDVHEKGCLPFRVFPRSDCEGEYDLVALRGDRLFLGARPADGNLCTEANRPIELTSRAVVREQQEGRVVQ